MLVIAWMTSSFLSWDILKCLHVVALLNLFLLDGTCGYCQEVGYEVIKGSSRRNGSHVYSYMMDLIIQSFQMWNYGRVCTSTRCGNQWQGTYLPNMVDRCEGKKWLVYTRIFSTDSYCDMSNIYSLQLEVSMNLLHILSILYFLWSESHSMAFCHIVCVLWVHSSQCMDWLLTHTVYFYTVPGSNGQGLELCGI